PVRIVERVKAMECPSSMFGLVWLDIARVARRVAPRWARQLRKDGFGILSSPRQKGFVARRIVSSPCHVRHSGAHEVRTSDVQLHIGESRDSGFALRAPRNDGTLFLRHGSAHALPGLATAEHAAEGAALHAK